LSILGTLNIILKILVFNYSNIFKYVFLIQKINKTNYFVYRDQLLQGFEISTLVFFDYNIVGMQNNRVFSRCISNLILVIREDVAESLQLDENLSITIPIYGLFLSIYFTLDLTHYILKIKLLKQKVYIE
jgi:hypothetical protein